MKTLRIAIIGCGHPRKSDGATGFGMSHQHMEGYKRAGNCELVAVADIKRENGEAFVQKHNPSAKVYTDYHQMLEEQKLDMVSISTWPVLHCEMVLAAAEAGAKAIHCEKPMAPTFGESKKMHEVCTRLGVQLTFNHQRRFNKPFSMAKELIEKGEIGKLVRLEAQCGNLYDWGTHWFDMLFNLNNDMPVEWVIGQVETRGDNVIFGVHVEGQGISHFKFKNEVRAIMITGHQADFGAQIRAVGTEGQLEIDPKDGGDVHLRLWKRGQGDWQTIPTNDTIHGDEANYLAVMDTVAALREGREPVLSSRRALQTTEVMFATYESARRGGRIDLPLDIDDSPYMALLKKSGLVGTT